MKTKIIILSIVLITLMISIPFVCADTVYTNRKDTWSFTASQMNADNNLFFYTNKHVDFKVDFYDFGTWNSTNTITLRLYANNDSEVSADTFGMTLRASDLANNFWLIQGAGTELVPATRCYDNGTNPLWTLYFKDDTVHLQYYDENGTKHVTPNIDFNGFTNQSIASIQGQYALTSGYVTLVFTENILSKSQTGMIISIVVFVAILTLLGGVVKKIGS